MFGYVLDHHSEGERERLELVSRLLYPTHHPYLEEFRIRPGARTLEDGSGNGSSTPGWPGEARPSLSISTCRWWMRSHRTSSSAKPTSSPDPSRPTSTCHRPGRAAPHPARSGRRRRLRPGRAILLIEPDFLPVGVARATRRGAFGRGWLAWSRLEGVEHFLGRRLPALVAALGLHSTEATLHEGGAPLGSRRSS
jgi:hypothetical protein